MSITAFRTRIRKSIANEALQIALDNNAERRVKGRINAFASLPDWRERRQRAHAVRADVIEHLDQYLDQFISKVQSNGIVVHRADNADEAIKIILEIVKAKHASPMLAKSKSMVSEEINLNHALEAEGIRVVETDLGEYIVQLRGERPSHIITPAVHLRRHEIAQLFHEKLGIPYTEDIHTLTNTARKLLREVFLTADVGLSGLNFGVAETGTLCLVTNEGNGRMVTTLPRVHIALMGMERLVPTLDDLALMLSLLPRSATGQKLSVYTQLLHKPLTNQQRHLIILDNGRSQLRESPLAEALCCIRCGACLNACPVFRELGGHAYGSVYPGPIGSVISAGLLGSEFVPLAQASSLCGACKEACPVDIDLPKLLTRVRAGQSPTPSRGLKGALREEKKGGGENALSPFSQFGLQMYSRVARNPKLFAASQRFAALGSYLVSPFSQWMKLPAFTGWGYSKDFPRFAGKPFRERFQGEGTRNTKALEKRVEKTNESRAPVIEIDKIKQFTQELTVLGGNVIHTNDLSNAIIDFLTSRQIDQIHLEPGILDKSTLQQVGIVATAVPDPAIRVAVTKAICGLADTGSILEADGEGDPLHASLLPEVHIAVLRASDILPSLSDAITLPQVRESKAAVVITGPSRTADIEMTLTIGVHGPKELHVFVVQD